MERIRLRLKTILFLLSMVVAVGCGTSALFLSKTDVMAAGSIATVDDGTNKTDYNSVEEALKGIADGEAESYTLMFHSSVILEPDTVLPNKKIKINAYQYTLTMGSGTLTVQNDLEFVSAKLDMENADILLKMASAGNHTVILPQGSGKVKAVREEFANGIVPDTDVKISGSGMGINLQIGELTGATDENGKAHLDVNLDRCGTVNQTVSHPYTPNFIKKAASVELSSSTWLSLSGNWEQLGCIRTTSTYCGLILTGDTVIDSFSLPTSSTKYMSELRIPAGNTLTTTNASTGYLKMTIEGTPEAGHVLIHAENSATSKMDVKSVTLPENMELVCVNTEGGAREYVLKNTNEWTEELKEASWIEHEMPKDVLNAEAKYGEVTYQFSGEIDGTYQNGLPEKEGTWYVKAIVLGGTDYTGLESTPVKIQITAPRKVEKIAIKNQPDQLVYEEGEKLNLSGLIVITTDNYGKETEIAVTDFAENGISISLANKTILTTKENGMAIEITSNGITAKTNTLTVTAKKIEKPEVPEKPAEGTTEKPEKPSEGTTATTEKPSENTTVVPTQTVTDNKSLRLVGAAGRTSIKLKWTKNNSADGYQIYGTTCGKNKYRLLKTVTKNSATIWTKTKLKKATSYRFYIRAYKISKGKKIYLQKSNEIHVVTLGGKATNAKNVKVTSGVIRLQKGKTKKITAKVSYVNNKQKPLKHAAGLKYDTSNKKVASVTTKGVIRAVGKGSCNIYVYAGNGVYTKVKIIVK